MENPIKMDDLGVPVFLETPIYTKICQCVYEYACTHQLMYIYPQDRLVCGVSILFTELVGHGKCGL